MRVFNRLVTITIFICFVCASCSKEYVNPYEDDPKDVKSISIEPDGKVLQGNIYQNNIIKILLLVVLSKRACLAQMIYLLVTPLHNGEPVLITKWNYGVITKVLLLLL